MADVNATLAATHAFHSAGQEVSYQFTSTSIAAGGGEDEIRMALWATQTIDGDEHQVRQGGEGKLIGVRVACESEDFDVSIRTDPGVTRPSIREILRDEDEDERYDGTTLGIYYWNAEREDYLYLVITNNDAVNPTGEIHIELIIGRM